VSQPPPNARPDPTAAPGATNAAGDGVQLSGRGAAQGRTGSRTFLILAASTVLVVLLLFGLWALNSPKLAQGGAAGGQSGAGAAARAFNAPADASPKQSPANTPSTEPGDVRQPGAH
jgi:hypothetical protein